MSLTKLIKLYRLELSLYKQLYKELYSNPGLSN